MIDLSKCDNAPTEVPTDAGVAGAGVLLAFIVTNFLSLGLAATIIFLELTQRSEAKTLRRLLMSFSDQQIITGIGILSVGLAKMTTMVMYHFWIVWMCGNLAAVTHIATLLALTNDFRRDWVLRWLRQFFMLVNLVLSIAAGVFVLVGVLKNLKPTLPIACEWRFSDEDAFDPTPRTDHTLSVVGTIAVNAAQLFVYAIGFWYLHLRERKWLKVVQVIAMVLLVAMGLGVTIRLIMVSQAFGPPSGPGVTLTGSSENEWSFGQLLTMLLLLLPLLSALEILRGEIHIKPPMVNNHIPLDDLGSYKDGRAAFQPAPFSRSRSEL